LARYNTKPVNHTLSFVSGGLFQRKLTNRTEHNFGVFGSVLWCITYVYLRW